MKQIAWIVIVFATLLVVAGCGGTETVKTEPEPVVAPVPPPPTAPPDPHIGQAYTVLRHFGTLTRRHMSYNQYQQKTGEAGTVSSVSPDWFYDIYSLELNEKGYWVTVSFQTARRAVARDPRIETLLGGAPHHAIDMRVKTPRGRRYILSDSEGDGVLDYAALQGKTGGTRPTFDAELRDSMQKTYSWILGVIKGYFQRIPRSER